MQNSGMFLAQTDSGAGYYPLGIFGLILGFSVLFVAVVWIVFPFLVNAKFNQLIREMRGLRADLKGKEKTGNRDAEVPPTLPKAEKSDVQKHVPPKEEVYKL